MPTGEIEAGDTVECPAGIGEGIVESVEGNQGAFLDGDGDVALPGARQGPGAGLQARNFFGRSPIMFQMRIMAILLALYGVAHADERLAKERYERGLRAYNLQEFKAALDQFRGAYVEKTDPAFLFNIAQCQRQLGMYDAASKSYRAYLNQSPDTSNRSVVEGLIHQMEEASKEAHARQPPTGTVAPQAVATAPPAPQKWYRSATGWSLAGGGVVVGFVGMGLWLHGNDLDGQIGSASSLAQAQQLEHDRDTFRTAGEVLVGVGGAALLGGAIVLSIRAGHQTRGAR